MNFSKAKLTALLVVTLVGGSLLLGQNLKNSPQEEKNEQIALRMFKDILEYHHVELAPELIAEGYIQHNPNVPTGRDAFVKNFSRFPPEPIKPEWKNKPALVITSGDLVFMMFEHTAKDPADPSKTYNYDWFDMVRVDDGKVQEHWDAAKKSPPRTQ
jgi:predicted SnoaL-like aldol condensation-catalyzing enzyme